MTRRRALLIGVNTYKDALLAGCVNDVLDLHELLVKHLRFAPDDVRVLLDQRATTLNILRRLDWLVGDAGPGDDLVFAFSGHGTRVRDRDGDELKDHLDECLVPVDFDWDAPALTDDDLAERFKRLPKGARLTVVLDCCSSGTGTRGGGYRTRFLPPPPDVALRAEGRALPVNRLGVKQRPGWLDVDPTMNHLLVAAARSDQTAADSYFGGRPNGALTRLLVDELTRSPGTTWLQVVDAVNQRLRREGFSQVAQLEGPTAGINSYPFGGR